MIRRALGVVAALAIAATGSAAQQVAETIASDRPGIGDGAHVLGAGVRQMEGGLAFESGRGPETMTVGQSLIRVGFGFAELRLATGSIVIQDETFGALDPAVGLKVPLVQGDTRVSAIVAGTVPIGAEEYTTDDPVGSVTLIGEMGLGDVLGLAVNAGYGAPFDDLGDATYTLIVTPGLAVGSVEGLSLYAGYAGVYDPVDDTHFFEWGLAYASTADSQYDLNFGINTENRRFFVGVGVAWRWR